MLLPDKGLVGALLSRYRTLESQVLADPGDPTVRRRFEDTAYTLCVLMGQRTAREAVQEAERYVLRRRARRRADAP
ncbi:hypothetical protein GCM10020367_62410 [Streptomyces sannanensis]|uniref:DUF5133 domain-containing protein n=1 Tax=Streptomyces sannanensis TaxID=285536 RepID=A0ABP6SKS9_9ACTN